MAAGKALGLIAATLIAGPALAKEADRAKLDEARSLAAEASLLERQHANGRVTGAYAKALGDDIRKDLDKLKKEPALTSAVQAALSAMDRHDAAALSAIADQLVARERALGRAG